MCKNDNNVNCGGCGCLSLTIFVILMWMVFTGRLVTLIDNLIQSTAQ